MTAGNAGFPARPPLSFTRLLEILFLLLLPVLTYWLFNYREIHQNGTLDPFFYTGYINNAEDLLKRFDLTYYSVRFGVILPGRFLTWTFGAEPGYFVLRYLLSLVAGIPLYVLVKRLFSPTVAVLTYAALITSPWFARTILWDHPDAFGVAYLMAAMCLVLLTRTPSWLRDGMAGFWVSMAVNSNVFTGVIFAIFATVYVGLSLLYGTPWRTLFRRSVMFGTGFVLVVAGGYSYYWQVFGKPRNIFLPTFNVANGLSHGGMKEYRLPGSAWLLEQFHVFVPVVVALCCLAFCLRRRMRFEVAVCTFAGSGVVAFFFVHQFLMEGDTLQLFYYFSYQLPTTFLMLVCIWQALWERYAWKSGVFLAISIAAILAPSILVSSGVFLFESIALPIWIKLAIATLALVSIAALPWRRRGVRAMLAMASLAAIAASLTLGMKSGVFRIARPFSGTDNTERDVYRVALQLIRESPKLKDGPGNLAFWYNNRRSSPINSVQSTYLWAKSSLNEQIPSDPGMPYLGKFQIVHLRNPEMRYVALLGETPDAVQQGLRALTEAKVGYHLLSTRDLNSGAIHVYWQLVEVTARPPDTVESGNK